MNGSRLPRLALALLALALLGCAAAVLRAEDAQEDYEFFERQVRPLLAEKCFSCHGRGQRKGELSLDSRAAVLAGGESGVVVVLGKPDESPLLEAVGYLGPIQMPPDAKLSEREIAVLTEWVRRGLPWPNEPDTSSATLRTAGTISPQDRQFWSFQPIGQPPLPAVQRPDWTRRPLDYFILHRLQREGLEPVAEADRRSFIRRASFDLLGLPPSEADVATFVNDVRPDAYERLIERLLASPHYGERWARHWLDVARYGEDQAHTFQARHYPAGFRYRDWVVTALNEDLPINQFFLEQIAGDLLTGAERMQQLPALGYFALGPVYYADAGCAPKAKADEYDDRIDTLCRGMLGLTVACARCHDHKFDPISMRDYYALQGIFASTEYAELPLAPPEAVKAYDDGQQRIQQAEQRVKEATEAAARELSESWAARTAEYLVAAWQVHNRRKTEPTCTVAAVIAESDLHELLVERWLAYLHSDAGKNNPALSAWHALIASQPSSEDLSSSEAASAAVRQVAGEIQARLVAAVERRREVEKVYREQLAELAPDAARPDKPALPDATASLLRDLIDDKAAPLAIPPNRREEFLAASSQQTLAELKQELEQQRSAAPPKYAYAHGLAEGQPVDSKIHLRGNVKELGEEVPRRFLAVLSGPNSEPFRQGSGRLELARAIIDPANPLTARVFVNRVWQHHFGRGIVGTPSNFGLLGERPTHPELLDYLAARFMASGWSLKQLHRDIMLSATYRLASTSNAANYERDPDNRLLWRMNRRRLDIESWRDAMLLVAGQLDARLGGPSSNLDDPQNRRRTFYAAISRHDLNPVLRLFDFPDPNLTSERRSMTTVPMQQLFVLNSDFMIRQARALAARLAAQPLPDDTARVDQLYRWIFGRAARDNERRSALDFLHGDVASSTRSDIKLSLWEQYAQALLGTNEFFFVD